MARLGTALTALVFAAAPLGCNGEIEPAAVFGSAAAPVGDCSMRPWYPDPDRDWRGSGRAVMACFRPAGHVTRDGDNCPREYNPAQTDSDGDGRGDACDPAYPARSCRELTDYAYLFDASADDGADTTLSAVREGALAGRQRLVLETSSGGPVRLRYERYSWWPLDVREARELQVAVRAFNPSPYGFQIGGPDVVLEDTRGRRRTLRPTEPLLSRDGTWRRLAVPIAGGVAAADPSQTWESDGAFVDIEHLRAVELVADTWDAGFVLEADGLAFASDGEVCELGCPEDCNGRGVCDPEAFTCACDVGAEGDACEACRAGFVERDDGACVPPADETFSYWPNPASAASSDPWLAVHHDEIEVLRPRVLALHFANTHSRADALAAVDAIRNGFAEASRGRDGGAPQLAYELAHLADLRDGVAGRPPAPAGWGPNNSTLFPRRDADEPGAWRADYAELFSEGFAELIGMPDAAGQPSTLCELAERGDVHEVWLLVSGDKPDANLAEVLEHKQRYDAAGNKLPGSFDRCAGNGCFDLDVPRCDVSIRVGTVNLDRGPGCYLHSQGHGLEGTARRDVVPGLSDWFLPFAGFDLGEREDLPFADPYGIGCSGPPPEPDWGPGCLEHDGATATFHHNGTTLAVEPWDGRCGSVHFPPNARSHYDYGNDEAARTTCKTYGTPSDTVSWVNADSWSAFDAVTPDCGGGFLTWWFRQMPAYGSEHAFDDGRRMKSVWPYLFY